MNVREPRIEFTVAIRFMGKSNNYEMEVSATTIPLPGDEKLLTDALEDVVSLRRKEEARQYALAKEIK